MYFDYVANLTLFCIKRYVFTVSLLVNFIALYKAYLNKFANQTTAKIPNSSQISIIMLAAIQLVGFL